MIFRLLSVIVLTGMFGPLFGKTEEGRAKDIRDPIAIHTDVTPRGSCVTQGTGERGLASWYGPGFHGRTMANGKPYDMYAHTVAHPTLPFGTVVCVKNTVNGRTALATVTDRGPYVKPRIVDLSRQVADNLRLTDQGIGVVELVPVFAPPHTQGGQTASRFFPHGIRLQRRSWP